MLKNLICILELCILTAKPHKGGGKIEAFTFNYLRADGNYVEMGPYLSADKAGKSFREMVGFGAICSEVYPIIISEEKGEEIGAREKGGAAGLLNLFESYLSRELEIVNHSGVKYEIVYGYLGELAERVRRYVRANIPHVPDDCTEESPPEYKFLVERCKKERGEFLLGVCNILLNHSLRYDPLDGSVPEDIKRKLEGLSRTRF